MVEQKNMSGVKQMVAAFKKELQTQRRRARALKFKRSKAEYATREEWESFLATPTRAKATNWIVCLVCRQKCKSLPLHLKPHNLSADRYRELFGYEPGAPLVCDELDEKFGRLAKNPLRLCDEEIEQCVQDPFKTKTIRGPKWIACIAGGKCGMLFRQITPLHLRKHGLSKKDYLDQLEWNYQQTLVSGEMTEDLKARAAVSKTLVYGKRGVAPGPRAHRKGRTMSKAWRLKQSERMRGNKFRVQPVKKRGPGKSTRALLFLCAAFEKAGKSVYAMAPILYSLGPTRDRDGAEAATRLLRKRNVKEIGRLAALMTDSEARQRIADAGVKVRQHP